MCEATLVTTPDTFCATRRDTSPHHPRRTVRPPIRRSDLHWDPPLWPAPGHSLQMNLRPTAKIPRVYAAANRY
jgi:hypothetical protein